MRFSTTASVAVAACAALASAAPASQPVNPTASNPAAVYAAQATARTLSPTSHVKGRAFDRYVSIWFENTDFDMAQADPNFAFFASKGITLENLFAVTHPSEPNYVAAFSGDYYGMNNDDFTQIPENVSTVVDLLEERGISWSFYQEDMPYSGYQGYNWLYQKTGANDYVRKHNPGIIFNSMVNGHDRLPKIKNTTIFYEDLKNDRLPQWMFITPNMTSDGHDSSVTVAGNWLRGFLEPLLEDPHFMKNTMVLITFDENETYTIQNRVFSVLLGDAIPQHLVGTSDPNYYDHYSQAATVEANWDLFTLGRFDVGANVFKNVADLTGDQVQSWSAKLPLADRYFNLSYPGMYNDETTAPEPVPNVLLANNGRIVLPKIIERYILNVFQTYYHGTLETPDGYHPPSDVFPQCFKWMEDSYHALMVR